MTFKNYRFIVFIYVSNCLDYVLLFAIIENQGYLPIIVPNHVKLLHVYKSRRGFSKGTVLCGGY